MVILKAVAAKENGAWSVGIVVRKAKKGKVHSMNNIVTIRGIADVIRKYLTYNSLLLKKYKIMLAYTLSSENKDNQEEILKTIKTFMPDLQIIALENRNELPKAVWQDKELDGLSDCLDALNDIVNKEKKEEWYSTLVKRANILVILDEQVCKQAAKKNTQGMQALLAMENKIYRANVTELQLLGDTIIKTSNEAHFDMSSLPLEKQKIYAISSFVEECMVNYGCNTVPELEKKLNALAKKPNSKECKDFEKAYGIPLTPEMVRNYLHSDECYKGSYLHRYFMDLEALATMGELESIQHMLDEEERLFTLPLEWLDNFMTQLEQNVGLR